MAQFSQSPVNMEFMEKGIIIMIHFNYTDFFHKNFFQSQICIKCGLIVLSFRKRCFIQKNLYDKKKYPCTVAKALIK